MNEKKKKIAVLYSIVYAKKGKEREIFYFFNEPVDVRIEHDKYIIYTFYQCIF